jgi:BatD DUF11 like domain
VKYQSFFKCYQIKDIPQCLLAVAVCLLLFMPFEGSAQGGKIIFQATTSKKEVATGGSLQVSFKLVGSVGGTLREPDFGGFRAGGMQEVSGMQIINGDVQGQHTWTFNLIAPAAGDYTIPEAKVVVNGKTYISNPLKIKVIAGAVRNGGSSPNQLPAGADPKVFVTTELNTTNVYPGQQIICTVNIYTQINLSGIDMVSVPKPSQGSLKEMEKYDSPQTEEFVGGQRYVKQAIYAASFFPETVGTVTLSPAEIRTAVASNNILAPRQIVSLKGQAVNLNVKPLPQPSPAGFTGLVGNYQVDMQETQDSIGLGEALVVNLEVRGNSNPQLFAPPVIPAPDGLETFEPAIKGEDTFENGQEVIHTQSIEYTFSAKAAGDYTCTPTFVWFDPDSNKYVTWQKPIRLKVGNGIGGNTHLLTTPLQNTNSFWSSPKGIGAIALITAGILGLIYFLLTRKKKAKEQHEAAVVEEEKEEKPIVRQDHFAIEQHDRWQPKPLEIPNPAPPQPIMPPPAPVVPPPPVYTTTNNDNWSILEEKLYDGTDQKTFYALLYQKIKDVFATKAGMPVVQVAPPTIIHWMTQKGYSSTQVQDMEWALRTCEQVMYAAQDHTSERERALEVCRACLS